MRVDLPYADGTLSATLPPGSRLLSGEATAALPPLADLDRAVREALVTGGGSRCGSGSRPGGRSG